MNDIDSKNQWAEYEHDKERKLRNNARRPEKIEEKNGGKSTRRKKMKEWTK